MGKSMAHPAAPTGCSVSYRSPADWLAAADPNPHGVKEGWLNDVGGIALVRLGTLFDAVRVPENLVHLVTGSDKPEAVRERLTTYLPGGAVLRAPSPGCYYCLVEPGTTTWWPSPAAECLGDGAYLGVPHPDRSTPNVVDSYWISPLSRPGGVCSAGSVLSLVAAGACRADADDDSIEVVS